MRGLVLGVSLLFACAGNNNWREVQLAGQSGCLPEEVRIISGGGRSWVAECRGSRYVCGQISTNPNSSAAVCTRRGDAESRDPTPVPARARERYDVQEGRLGEQVVGLRARFHTVDSVVTILLQRDRPTRLRVASSSIVPLRGCDALKITTSPREVSFALDKEFSTTVSDDELFSVRTTTNISFCGRRWRLTEADVAGLRALHDRYQEILTQPAPVSPSETAVIEPASEDVAPTNVRAALDEHAEEIRACTSRDYPIRVDVGWTEGSASIGVEGASAAELECVNSLVTLPDANGEELQLVHVLRARE